MRERTFGLLESQRYSRSRLWQSEIGEDPDQTYVRGQNFREHSRGNLWNYVETTLVLAHKLTHLVSQADLFYISQRVVLVIRLGTWKSYGRFPSS